MTAELAQPLPECDVCGRPTRRAVHEATGGLCTACAAWDKAARVVGPQNAAEERQRLHEWQTTVARIRRAEIRAAAERRRRREARRAQRR